MTDLKDLARRVSELQGPSREVDAEIAINLDPDKPWIIGNKEGRFPQDPIWGTWKDLTGYPNMGDIAQNIGAPHFTASLDAAMTLVPSKWKLRQIYFSGPCADDRKWHLNLRGGSVGQDRFVGRGTTPALALTAAALIARSEA